MNNTPNGHIKHDTKPFDGQSLFETKITTEITMNELQALEVLRTMEYGEVTIKKQKGLIIQVIKKESIAPKEVPPKPNW